MAQEKKTRYVLLGLLSYKPMSGYDIKQAIERSLNFFWNESYGQIYPMLNALAGEGLVVKSVEEGSGKPDRHVYSITESGSAVLREWMEFPPEQPRHRMEILLKVFFGGATSKDVVIRQIEQFRKEQMELLETYLGIESFLIDRCDNKDEAWRCYSLMTLRCGIRVSQAMIDWCNETSETLARLP